MTIIKTDDLTPHQLNMLVAVAEGWQLPTAENRRWLLQRRSKLLWEIVPPDFCTSTTRASPIIDREHIATAWMSGAWVAFLPEGDAAGGYPKTRGHWINVRQGEAAGTAGSRIEAAMRAYVRKCYGDEILTTDKPWLLEAATA